jgi:hypothetical protein
MDAKIKVYEFIDRVAPFYMEWANITRASLRLLPIDKGKITISRLPTLNRLIADLLDHNKELQRTEKINLTLSSRPSHSSNSAHSNGKQCSYYKNTGHI